MSLSRLWHLVRFWDLGLVLRGSVSQPATILFVIFEKIVFNDDNETYFYLLAGTGGTAEAGVTCLVSWARKAAVTTSD